MSWGYEAGNGPTTWKTICPVAENGTRQSPIDIIPGDAVYDDGLASNPITVSYEDEVDMDVENTSKSVKAQITKKSTISGGPLDNTYQLEQFHLHWGSEDKKGSEHTIAGKEYAAELHLVHWNHKYGSFAKAASEPDGLAVFGIFLTVGKEHAGFKKFSDCLDCVQLPEKHEKVKGQFNPKCLLPNLSKYWTYPGSLTTPPLFESVTWIVFEEVMEVSESQLKSLRCLCRDCEDHHIVDNYRPPCPLGMRKVRAAFK